MITLKLTPSQYETICIALKLADQLKKKEVVSFVSEAFNEVLEDIKGNDFNWKGKPTKPKEM